MNQAAQNTQQDTQQDTQETNKYDNYSDAQLIAVRGELKLAKDAATAEIKIVDDILIDHHRSAIDAALKGKPEPFGVVNRVIGSSKVKFDTDKKVEWDQAGLASVYKQMILEGAKPEEYLKAEFKVSETAYKNWPSNIKEYFQPYRTVKPGETKISAIEPVKAA